MEKEVEQMVQQYRDARSARLRPGVVQNRLVVNKEDRLSGFRALLGLFIFGAPAAYCLYWLVFPVDPADNYWIDLEKKLEQDATVHEDHSLIRKAIQNK